MDIQSKEEDILALEQHLIDTLKPNLNVSLIASSTTHQGPMDQAMRQRMRKLKGTRIYVYEAETLCLLFRFDSKQYMSRELSMHHQTLNDCLDSGSLYLDYFFLSVEPIETESTRLLSLNDMKALVRSR